MTLFRSWRSLHVLSCIFVLIIMVSLAQGQCTTPTGYGFTKSLLSDSFQFHWTINSTDSSIEVAYEAKTAGWIGIGVSQATPAQMTGAEAVIAWAGASPSIHSFRLNEKDSSSFSLIDSLVPLRNATVCEYTKGGSIWTLGVFTRSLASGSNPLSLTSDVPMVIAFGSSDDLIEHASSDKLSFSLNLVTGELRESPAAKTKQTLQIVHGLLMVAGFGVFLPAGGIVARYTKSLFGTSWFMVHMLVQLMGYLLGFIAFVIALVMVDRKHFNTKAHAQLGLAVIVAGVCQLGLGFFRPAAVEKGDHKPLIRLLWEIAHHYLGRIINLVSVVTIFFGLHEIAAHKGFYIAYGIFVGLIAVTIVTIEIAKYISNRKKKRDFATNEHEL